MKRTKPEGTLLTVSFNEKILSKAGIKHRESHEDTLYKCNLKTILLHNGIKEMKAKDTVIHNSLGDNKW